MPSHSKIFFWFLLSFILAVAMATVFSVSPYVPAGLFLLAIIALAIDPKSRKNWMAVFILLGFCLGIFKTNQQLNKIYPREQEKWTGNALVEKVAVKDDYQQIVVFPIENNKLSSEKFLINVPLKPDFQMGEMVQMECQLKNPENKYEKFNYVRYLAMNNVFQICQAKRLSHLAGKDESSLSGTLALKIKILKQVIFLQRKLEEKINQLYVQPEGAYLVGLLLGGSSQLPAEIQTFFQRTGTTHTVAVSGYNITIIAEFLMTIGLALGLWRQQAFWLSVLGIWLFVMMIGFPASAVRAAVMGSLLLWAIKRGRLASSTRAIVFAGAVMIWLCPLILFYDTGFQLSFLATLGIVLLYAPIAEKFHIEKDFLELKSILLVTLAAQLGVFGIMLYNFETFSPISFIANLFILPLIPFIMLGGFIAAVLGFFSLSLAKIISLLVWLLLHWELAMVEYLAHFPWAMIEIKDLGLKWLIGYYSFFVMLVIKLRRQF